MIFSFSIKNEIVLLDVIKKLYVVFDIFIHFPAFCSLESVETIRKSITFENSFSSFLFIEASSKFVIF